MRPRAIIITLALAASVLLANAAAAQTSIVETDKGPVAGTLANGRQTFSAIPYAAPPIGQLRWKSPQPAAAWTTPHDATKPAPGCMQPVIKGQTTAAPVLSEDCLFLNVIAPAAAAKNKTRLPVMVWIHGGGFSTGSAFDYVPARLVSQGNVIVVTINYRLGVFGFFGYPGLKDSGTFGLLDQQIALRWVRNNIEGFGGDAKNVTVFGESAGGMSVCAQLASPTAAGLFDKAIVQSGSCIQSWPPSMIYPGVPAFRQFVPRSEQDAEGSKLAAALKCGDGDAGLACLRIAPAADMIAKWNASRPAYGTQTLPEDPATALRAGRIAHIPVMWGGTRDEERSFVAALELTQPMSAERYRVLVRDGFGADAEVVEKDYPVESYPNPATAWASVATDSSWSCPTLASDRAAAINAPVYAYEFADRNAPNPAFVTPPNFLGAAHATELAYLFELGGKHTAFTQAQEELASQMVRYWTNFARSSNPNGAGLPVWNSFKATNAMAFVTEGPHEIDLEAEHHCRLWDASGDLPRVRHTP